MSLALELKGVVKEYEGFKLDHLDLTLPKGCIMGLIGENGAGKSTTIKLILDLIPRDGGEINILGQSNLDNLKGLKENIGVVHDESYFPEAINGNQINKIMKHIYTTWDEQAFIGYLDRFSIQRKKPLKEYSRGMKMKLSIATALSHDSKLLILDEATSGLDPVIRDEILTLFQEFIQDEEKSILMSSHIVSDLEKVCDYIAFIHKGKLIFNDPKDELLENYCILKCDYTEFESIDPSLIIGSRKSAYGIEALIKRTTQKFGGIIDQATIEDIMLFYIKEVGK